MAHGETVAKRTIFNKGLRKAPSHSFVHSNLQVSPSWVYGTVVGDIIGEINNKDYGRRR